MMVSFRTFFSLYAALAFFYTGTNLVIKSFASLTLDSSSIDRPYSKWTKLVKFLRSTRPLSTVVSAQNHVPPTRQLPWSDVTFGSKVAQYLSPLINHSKESHTEVALNEDLFLSRAFSQAMRPSRIIPFYYRASGSFSRDDITIATLVTGNRFEVLARLVQRYQGPISVAIHVTDTLHRRSTLLNDLHELYTKTPGLAEFLDVHLVLDVFERQFNTWRNVARFFAAHRSDFVLMLDVDFALCTDFRTRVRNSAGSEVIEKLKLGTAALVIPAFEYTDPQEGFNESAFPRSKEDLLSLVRAGRLGMFHAAWEPGHSGSNYKRYYTSSPGEVYPVTDYQQAYEPYVIFKNTGTVWCDERFIGYGGNKAACLFEMWLSGVEFFVLSDDFIIHQSHPYAEHARKHERRYNRKTYMDFREETCLRYLLYFLAAGTLDTSRTHNLRSECRKIKGFARIAAELIATYRRD